MLLGSRGSFVGDRGRMGGVSNLGGLPLKEPFKALASADSLGPGIDCLEVPSPGSGVSATECSPVFNWLGVGICRTEGEPMRWEGTGDASL